MKLTTRRALRAAATGIARGSSASPFANGQWHGAAGPASAPYSYMACTGVRARALGRGSGGGAKPPGTLAAFVAAVLVFGASDAALHTRRRLSDVHSRALLSPASM